MTSKGAVKTQPKASELRFTTKNDGPVHVHPSSVNYTVSREHAPLFASRPRQRRDPAASRRPGTTTARTWCTTRR